MEFNFKQIVFLGAFLILAMLSMQLNIIPIWGSPGQYFDTFNFFAPIAGGFIGTGLGVAAVFAAEIANFLIQGQGPSTASIILLFPILTGVWFFSKPKLQNGLLVTAAGVALWMLNPIGREAWYYSLLFFVPLVASKFENLAGRSLGSAYTAFVAGQVLWLYFIPTTASDWASWIPGVILERTGCAIGIGIAFVLFNTLLARVPNYLPETITLEKKYDLIARAKGMAIG